MCALLKLAVSSKNSVSEVRALTGLRGVAALYVVFFHYFSPLRLTSPIMCIIGHGYLAVDLFFVLSGFVMALNYAGLFSQGIRASGVRIFLSRRVARIYPLYLLTLLIATGLVVIGHLDFSGGSLARTFWPNLLMVQNWGNWESIETPAWSISTEWFAYMLFPFLLTWVFFRSRAGAFAMFVLCVSSLFYLAAFFTSPYDQLKVFDLTKGYPSLVRCVAEFTLGIIAYRVRDSRFGAAAKNLTWLPVTLVVLLLLLLALKRTDVAGSTAFSFSHSFARWQAQFPQPFSRFPGAGVFGTCVLQRLPGALPFSPSLEWCGFLRSPAWAQPLSQLRSGCRLPGYDAMCQLHLLLR